jgi:hypothetical protein
MDVTGSAWEWQSVTHSSQKDEVTFSLTQGDHMLEIKLREDGTKLDKFKVTQIVADTGTLFIDATDYSSMSGWWEVWTDADGNEYLASDDYGDAFYSGAPSNHEVSYNFSVTEAGDYQLFGKVSGAHGHSNSFWIQIDDGEWVEWHFTSTGNGNWEWQTVTNGSGHAEMLFNLSAGSHTLNIRMREDGAMLSQLALTNDLTLDADDIGLLA